MASFIIMTDSTTDLTQDFYEKSGVKHEPHGFVIDGEERKDRFWQTVDKAEYYKMIKEGKPISTTQADLATIYRDVEEAFAQGKDALYICFSSKLSGTYNTTRMVAAEMEEKYPGRCFYTVDTCCASMGQGWLVQKAADMAQNGASLDQVIKCIEAEKDKIYHFFTVDDLMHLKRGGRLSATSAVMGTLIGIKPILHMSDDGRLEPIAKIRGRHNAIDELVKMAIPLFDESTDIILLASTGCNDEVEYIKKQLKDKKIKIPVYVYDIGPAISGHTGYGTVGILFHSDK